MNSNKSEKLKEQTMKSINEMLAIENIKQNEVQKEMLSSHIDAMIYRFLSNEQLPDIDVNLFTELSDKSLALARQTVAMFDGLPDKEAYLLAIHYDVARANDE